MDSLSQNLVHLAELYAKHKNVRLWRIGHQAAGRGGFFVDIKAGRSCRTNTYETVVQWFSDHWPDEQVLPWPEHLVPRPPRSQPGEAA